MEDCLIVLCNVPDQGMAEQITRALLEQRQAACVNILPGVQSMYRWQGQIEQAQEITLLVKTTAPRYADVETTIRNLHPYSVPEVLAIPVAAGYPAYLQWLREETRNDVDA